MITTRAVTKRIGARAIVDGLDLDARDGRITGLLGPNGAGKTTTLRMLAGLVHADAGTISIDGIDVSRDPLGARRRLGVLTDDAGLYARLTARDHLIYAARLHGLAGGALERAIARGIELAGLAQIIDRRAAGFSRGERQRLALGRALVHDPQNVVLDEPTSGLDVAANRALRATTRRLAGEGRCVVFSSHVMQDVAALCDDIVVLDRGRVVARGTPGELLERTGQATLEDAFLATLGDGEGLQ